MPIRPFLDGAAFESEAIRNMSVVFESVCGELGLSDKDDPATRLVASKIIEFAERRLGRCTAVVHDTQGIQARIASGGGAPLPAAVDSSRTRGTLPAGRPGAERCHLLEFGHRCR